MGYSVRSRTYRYTEWVRFNRRSFKPVWSSVEAAELYDHSVDPGDFRSDLKAKRGRMGASFIPLLLFTIIFGVIAILLPIFVPKNPYRG